MRLATYPRGVYGGRVSSPANDRSEQPPWRAIVRTGLDWRRWTPWEGRATAGDWVLMGTIAAVVIFGAVTRRLTPFLIATHPVLLEFANGSLTAVGAAAAFARVGEIPLWLVIVAGAVGMAKFDWMTWWAGRRWGSGMLAFFMSKERAAQQTERVAALPRWMLALAVAASPLPGVPSALVCVLAGWARMRLVTFLALNLAGAVVTTTAVAAIGFTLGQTAIDIVLLVDRYAGWVSLSLIALLLLTPSLRRAWSRWVGRRRPAR